jgi:hypothetical protein
MCHRFLLLKHKKDKTYKKTTKKNQEKGRSFFLNSRFALPFLVPTSTFPLLPFCFKRFLLASSYSQAKEKKKNHGEEKKCRERRELSFKLLFYLLTFGSHFCPSVSNAFFWHLLVFKQNKK